MSRRVAVCARWAWRGRHRVGFVWALAAGLVVAALGGDAALAAPARTAPARTGLAAASSAGPEGGLTMAAAVARALGRSPALAAQRAAARAAGARADQAATGWLPRASAEAYYRYVGPVPALSLDTGLTLPGQSQPMTITRDLGTPHQAGVSARVGWRAWDFGARDARTAAARALARTAQAQGDARAAEIAFAVRAAYLGAAFTQDVAALTRASQETAAAQLRDARAKRGAGLASDLAVAGAETRLTELDARLADADAARDLAAETLALLVQGPDVGGTAGGSGVRLAQGLKQAGARLRDAVRAQAGAGSQGETPTLEALARTERGLALQARAVARAAWPTLDLFAQLAFQFPKTFVETDQAGIAYAAGVSLKWDLFDGGVRAAQRRELGAQRAQVVAQRQAVDEELVRRRAEVASHARAARDALAAAARREKAAAVYVRVARAARASGAGTDLEVRGAEAALDMARLATARARFDVAMAYAQTLRVAGVAVVQEEPPGAHGAGEGAPPSSGARRQGGQR